MGLLAQRSEEPDLSRHPVDGNVLWRLCPTLSIVQHEQRPASRIEVVGGRGKGVHGDEVQTMNEFVDQSFYDKPLGVVGFHALRVCSRWTIGSALPASES